ncbi:MAG: MotA/TolQ/ExbB proton channel family protein [Myxococcota bacterium]
MSAFLKYVELGGFVMPPLILLTMLLWYGLGYRVSILRRGRGLAPRQLVNMVESGELGNPRSAVERAAVTGVALGQAGPHNLRDRLEDALGRESESLAAFDVITASIVAVAPLLGLLGTVSGMIETFASLGDMTLTSQSGGIAGGISQALLTTQFGLAVAIPGLVVRGLLQRRQRVFESQIDEIKDIVMAKSLGEAG